MGCLGSYLAWFGFNPSRLSMNWSPVGLVCPLLKENKRNLKELCTLDIRECVLGLAE